MRPEAEERARLAGLSRHELEEEVLKAQARVAEAEGIEASFLSAMTHELRTPLNAILGFTDVILQGLSGPLTEVQVRQLGSVDRAAKRLIELINDVLDLSKAQAGKLQLSREEFDLGRLIRKVATEIGAEAERRSLPLSVKVPQNAERAIGDMRKTEQVLRHLLSNAVKFTEKGEVRIEALREEGEVAVLVTDTGIGIAPEQMELLFRPFRQLDTGHTRRYEGLGLGLSLSKLLIEAMGGRIWVESEPGRGSTFGFSLPALGAAG